MVGRTFDLEPVCHAHMTGFTIATVVEGVGAFLPFRADDRAVQILELVGQTHGREILHRHKTICSKKQGISHHTLADAVVDKRLNRCLHTHVLFGANVTADNEGVPQVFGQFGQILAGAVSSNELLDLLLARLAQIGLVERLLEERTGVGQFDVVVAILEVADVTQREDRLAAITLAAADSSNGAGGRHRGLSGIANAVHLDAVDDFAPVEGGASPVAAVFEERLRRLPLHAAGLFVVVDAAFVGQERATFLGQFDALLHTVEAHKLHHLCGEFLPFLAAVANADFVHQVAQPHDAQADATGAVGRFRHFRHRGDIRIGAHHIVEEVCALAHRAAQRLPIKGSFTVGVGCHMDAQVDRAETAVFIRTKPLFATVMHNDAIGNE